MYGKSALEDSTRPFVRLGRVLIHLVDAIDTIDAMDPVEIATRLRRAAKRTDRLLMPVARNIDRGLGPQQQAVLALINAQPGVTVAQLAVQEQVRHQSMAGVVAGLVSKGLVAVRSNPSDQRQQLLTVTESGSETVAACCSIRDDWYADALRDALTDEELRLLAEAVELLERTVGKLNGRGASEVVAS